MIKRHTYTCSKTVLVVYGGGVASVWGYEGDFGVKYDVFMATMVDRFRPSDRYDSEIMRGVQVSALKTIYRIGHVHVGSLGRVVNAYAMWVSLAAGTPQVFEGAALEGWHSYKNHALVSNKAEAAILRSWT